VETQIKLKTAKLKKIALFIRTSEVSHNRQFRAALVTGGTGQVSATHQLLGNCSFNPADATKSVPSSSQVKEYGKNNNNVKL